MPSHGIDGAALCRVGLQSCRARVCARSKEQTTDCTFWARGGDAHAVCDMARSEASRPDTELTLSFLLLCLHISSLRNNQSFERRSIR